MTSSAPDPAIGNLGAGDVGCASFHTGSRNQWRFDAADLRVLDRAFGALEDVTPQHLGQGAALRARCRVHGGSPR